MLMSLEQISTDGLAWWAKSRFAAQFFFFTSVPTTTASFWFQDAKWKAASGRLGGCAGGQSGCYIITLFTVTIWRGTSLQKHQRIPAAFDKMAEGCVRLQQSEQRQVFSCKNSLPASAFYLLCCPQTITTNY